MYYNLNLNRQSLVSSAVREFSYCLYHRHISHVDHMPKALHKSITCPYICYLTTNLFVLEFCTCGMTSGPIKIDQLITDNECAAHTKGWGKDPNFGREPSVERENVPQLCVRRNFTTTILSQKSALIVIYCSTLILVPTYSNVSHLDLHVRAVRTA